MSEDLIVALKPCPFCGGYAVVAPVTDGDECYVVCTECYTASDHYPDYEEAVKAWNKRVQVNE
jgi:Lar family restriction alleviation protein